MQAIIWANGELSPGLAVDEALAAAPGALSVAADGGARHALALGLTPDVVIGDMDSLTEQELGRCADMGAILKRYPQEKDETDLELALTYVAEQGATWLRIIGGIGDRLDQTLANVLLLTLPILRGIDVRLVAGHQSAWLLAAGEHRIAGAIGDTLSLIPLGGDGRGISTDGLVYPLANETLVFGPARGISNVFAAEAARVGVTGGIVLAVHTRGRA
jgi:thiamine pyrophosphokinase